MHCNLPSNSILLVVGKKEVRDDCPGVSTFFLLFILYYLSSYHMVAMCIN